jgi:transposase
VEVAFNFVPCDREQDFLLPPSLKEWLPEDHLAWFLIDAVEEMRLDAFLGDYRADGWGRAAYDPRMMVTLLLYAYAIGERSSRQIERRCREDVAFRVISANAVPDHATIARFRDRHEQALSGLFVEVLRLCAEAGLVRVGMVAIDGTKIAANASLRANRSYSALGEEVERILAEAAEADAAESALYGERRGDELPDELAQRGSRLQRLRAARERLEAQVCEQHAEHALRLEQRAAKQAALPAGKRLRGRRPAPAPAVVAPEAKANTSDPDSRILRDGIAYVQGYNAQAAVAEGQIIVAAELVQDTNDRHQLTPMLAKTEETLAAIGHEEEIGVCLADAGYWDTDALEAIVERGQRLIVNPDTSNPRRQRVADPRRSYPRAPRMEGIRLAMHETLASDEGRALYAARRELAEPVFGQTKVTRRADRFLRRGLDACQSEWRLICATHNLLKLWRQPALAA